MMDDYNFWLPYKASFNVGLHVEWDIHKPGTRICLATHNCEAATCHDCDEDCKSDAAKCGYDGVYQQLYLSKQDCKDLAAFLLRISE